MCTFFIIAIILITLAYFIYAFYGIDSFRVRRLNGKIEDLCPYENFIYMLYLILLNIILLLLVL